MAELLEDGEIQRHVRRARRIYHRRRDDLCAALDAHLAGALCYTRPAEGLAVWARVAASIDADVWQQRCRKGGVHFQSGSQFTFDGYAIPFVRLGYAALDERALATAVRVLQQALP